MLYSEEDTMMFTEEQIKQAVDIIPPNYCFKPGDRVKYTTYLYCSVREHHTRCSGTIVRTYHDNAFYTIKGDHDHKNVEIPYFLTCPIDKDLYYEHWVKKGTVVFFRKDVKENFQRGIVSKVHYSPAVKYNGEFLIGYLDIVDKNNETTYTVPPMNYMFDIAFYKDIIRNYQNRNTNNINYDRTPFFKEIIENIMDYSVEKLKKDLMDNKDRIPFSCSVPDFDKIMRYLRIHLNLKSPIFPEMTNCAYVDIIVKRLGSRYYLKKQFNEDRKDWSYNHYIGNWIHIRPVPPEILDEIVECAFIPTKHCGTGGALFRESMQKFINNY